MLLQEFLENNKKLPDMIDYIDAKTINEEDVEYIGSHYIDTYWYRVCVYEEDLLKCELVDYKLDAEKRTLYVDLIANKYAMDIDKLIEILEEKDYGSDDEYNESTYKAMIRTLEDNAEIWW